MLICGFSVLVNRMSPRISIVWRSLFLCLTFCVGYFAVLLIDRSPGQRATDEPSPIVFGTGQAACRGPHSSELDDEVPVKPISDTHKIRRLRLMSKPRPQYTGEARLNQIQGTVILRVTFIADGSIGDISVVKGLPYGLTEQAIAAAHRMKFQPEQADGKPTTISKQVEYTFTIY